MSNFWETQTINSFLTPIPHTRDIQRLKDWLKKLLRDACLGEILASRLNNITRKIVQECAAASANAASSSKLKGKGKRSRK